MELSEIRTRINTIDEDMIVLLARRSELVDQAGRLKKDEQAVRDQERVEAVIAGVREKARGHGLEPDIAEQIYRTIIDSLVKQELRQFRERTELSDSEVVVCRAEDLPLHADVPGARKWAVALEKSMLTYFELEPGTVFPEHSHEAEQITLVAEGELTFSYSDKTVTLGPGDVVAIPSNVRHSARTGSAPCKAVDAWSPPRKEFLSVPPGARQ